MKKRFAAMALGLGLVGALLPMAGTAQAAECVGLPAFPDTYACVIRRDLVQPEINADPVFIFPETCIIVCIQEQRIPLIDVIVHDDEVVVVYYNGKCYYVGNNHVWTRAATSIDPPACP